MLPGDYLPVDRMEEQSNPTKGSASVQAAQEILSARDPVSRGNTTPTDLISTQPLPVATGPAGASQEEPGHKNHQNEPKKPTRPQRGLTVQDHRLPPSLNQTQGSSLSVHSSRSRGSGAGSKQPATTQNDSCFQLLLACLWCQCSVLLLGLLESCSSCLHALCSSCCCHACTCCCSAIQEAPVEEFNCHAHCHAHCHSVLFETCCEPTECLEFCLECCEICHRS